MSVALTAVTLLALWGYAKDTKRIANDSATQVDRGQMPFLTIAMEEGDGFRQAGWILQNQGFGPALNIRYTFYDHDAPSMRPTPPMGPADKRRNLHNQISEALGRGKFRIEYESLTGKKYRTVAASIDGALVVQFENPAADFI